MNKKVQLQDLGSIAYKEAWDYQDKLFQSIIDVKLDNRKNGLEQSTLNYFLFVEHPHVYTLGKSGNMNNLLVSENELIKKDAKFYKINRGGDITYHGPGQLVAYPIFDLDYFFTDIHKYMRYLEEAVILTLKDFGITGRKENGALCC